MDQEEKQHNWYVLRVFTGKEEMVKTYLDREIEQLGIQDSVGEILIPTDTVIEMRDGKKREKKRVFFPGYLLVEITLNAKIRYVISNAPNVIGFAGNPKEPPPLSLNEVNRILGRIEEKRDEIVIDIPFQVDDKVKINDGPFNDFIGSIKEINKEKRKLKVLVSIFGRSTPVEVDFLQVTTNISQ
ncbi:MAG: transcription termination/antitermination protein NusG [Candidatus Hatepunaea meridiana]|nr:transcription termination/antitermination protein NusG [Candidatus Hatepunaea meridiana]